MYRGYACILSIAKDYVEAILALPALQEWIKAGEAEQEIISAFEF
ncbi:hypothetical protein [Fischerella sp.]